MDLDSYLRSLGLRDAAAMGAALADLGVSTRADWLSIAQDEEDLAEAIGALKAAKVALGDRNTMKRAHLQQGGAAVAPQSEAAHFAPAAAAGSTRSILNGSYDIVRALGRGSFGMAYLVTRAHKDGGGGEFACKSLACATLQEANAGLEEVLAMTKNAHPHLVECCEQGIEQDADGQFVVRIIMEFCDRGDLQAAIERGVPFSAARVLSWARQVLSALQFLHERKISHRDVKPANIMLCGADLVAKLGDLGLASSRDGNSTRSVAGTIAFMAPEMFSGTYGLQVPRPPPRSVCTG